LIGQRKKKKKQDKLMESLKGIYKVNEISNQDVILEETEDSMNKTINFNGQVKKQRSLYGILQT
jgi:ABC-type bacteriocin/lantibiotic exporter with double-glycine peptidase domain